MTTVRVLKPGVTGADLARERGVEPRRKPYRCSICHLPGHRRCPERPAGTGHKAERSTASAFNLEHTQRWLEDLARKTEAARAALTELEEKVAAARRHLEELRKWKEATP